MDVAAAPLPRSHAVLARVTREHGAYLHCFARHLCGASADADDLVQDALVAALARAQPLATEADLRAWLTTVMRHRFIDRCRRQRTRHALARTLALAPAAVADDDPPWWRDLDVAEVRAQLATLPPALATPFAMFALERASYRAIAAALDIPVATVGTRILRARQRLRLRLTAARASRAAAPGRPAA